MVASLNLALMQCPSFSLAGFSQMRGSVCVWWGGSRFDNYGINTGVPGFDFQYTCV